MQTVLEITEVFSSVTQAQRAESIRALLKQFLKNELARRDSDGT